MPKYQIYVWTDTYIRYVAECEDEDEAKARGEVDFVQGALADASVSVEVEQVPDDTPEGDC